MDSFNLIFDDKTNSLLPQTNLSGNDVLSGAIEPLEPNPAIGGPASSTDLGLRNDPTLDPTLDTTANILLPNSDLAIAATEPATGKSDGDVLTGTEEEGVLVRSNPETLPDTLIDGGAIESLENGGVEVNNALNPTESPPFSSGVFTVGESGDVSVDFLFDGGKYKGELALFSLEGMDAFVPGSPEFIQEAASRALSNSELGYVAITDASEGAKFSGVLGEHEDEDWNTGEYLGAKVFAMRPGDEVGLMFVPNGKIQKVFDNPEVQDKSRPLFSMAMADSEEIFGFGKIADITGDGTTFSFGDGYGDSDYNDFVFQIQGAAGNAVLMDEVIEPENDWRNSEAAQDLVEFVVDPLDLAGNTPDEARNSSPSTDGKTYRGWVGSTDTDDYYSFSLGTSNEFNLSLDGLWAEANVEVLDFEGNVVLSSANPGTTAESISGILEHGAYRIRVASVGDIGTPYDLNLSVTPTLEGITTTGSDAIGSISTNASSELINIDDFRSGTITQDSRPEFAGIDGSGFSTVIIDTGIDLDHPFFDDNPLDNNGDGISDAFADDNGDNVADRIVFNFDFADNDANASDTDDHGSNVASIAASADPTFTGMAPQADIIALKIFQNNSDTFDFADLEQALQWVVVNAETFNIASINMSIGNRQNYYTSRTLEGIDDELAALANRGVIVVSAAGNDFHAWDSQQGVAYPAADPNSLAVGAVWDGNNGGPWNWRSGAIDSTTDADRITSFSQRHDTLTDIFAPGAMITGASATGGTVDMGGTSQAAPHIAGMAVLAQQRRL